MFKQAVKTESKLRLAIAGPSGSGKTYTALALAAALVPGGKVAVIDTEHGSASKYADMFSFDVAPVAPPYHPDGLIKLVTFAAGNGYDVVIVDSLSHYWSGSGGVLDLKENAVRKMRTPNDYTAWRDVTPVHQHMVDTLIGVNAHVIVTMRSKQDYVLTPNKDGKLEPKKVGMAPVQRDGVEYEFDVMMEIDIEHIARVQKTRCPALVDGAFLKPGEDVAGILRDWLAGASPTQAPPPVVFQPVTPTPPANGKPTAAQPAQPATVAGPLPDDELTIEEASAAQFIAAAAGLLETDTETLKARMKALGYERIPGKPAERVAAYRRLRADMGAAADIMQPATEAHRRSDEMHPNDPAQPALVTVDGKQPGREYQD